MFVCVTTGVDYWIHPLPDKTSTIVSKMRTHVSRILTHVSRMVTLVSRLVTVGKLWKNDNANSALPMHYATSNKIKTLFKKITIYKMNCVLPLNLSVVKIHNWFQLLQTVGNTLYPRSLIHLPREHRET